jgi:hypothetical protein
VPSRNSVRGSFLSFSGWGETESTWYVGHCWPIVPAPDDRWWPLWSSRWNEYWQGKPKYSEKTCPSSTLSTTNPTWPDMGSNPGRRAGKPATNRLNYGTVVRPRFLRLLIQCGMQWFFCVGGESSAAFVIFSFLKCAFQKVTGLNRRKLDLVSYFAVRIVDCL